MKYLPGVLICKIVDYQPVAESIIPDRACIDICGIFTDKYMLQFIEQSCPGLKAVIYPVPVIFSKS